MIEHDKFLRLVFHDLPAKLLTNRASRTGYHYNPSSDHFGDSFAICAHGISSEQIFYL